MELPPTESPATVTHFLVRRTDSRQQEPDTPGYNCPMTAAQAWAILAGKGAAHP